MALQEAKQQLVILGTGVFAEEVADLASDTGTFELKVFVEGIDREKCDQCLAGIPVVWIEEVAHLDDAYRGVCAVGSTRRKGFIEQARAGGLKFTNLVHPTAHVAPSATLGDGVVVSAGAVIAAHTRIGAHVVVNRGSLIGHHADIGAYATIGPGGNIAAKTHIGEQAYIAMGAIVLDRISIGRQAVVGAGAVVTRDVPDRVQVVGIPAKIIRENIEGM